MNTAYNIDCMEYMKALPDKAFDLAVVDPPYGDAGGGEKLAARNGHPAMELGLADFLTNIRQI